MTMLHFDKTIYSDLTYLGSAESYLDEILDNIENIPLFNSFNTIELKALSHYLHCYATPRSYRLATQNAAADHLVILLSGEVSLIDESTGKVDDHHSVGATLGISSLVQKQVWDATCITNKPSDIAVLSRTALDQILVHNPRLGNKLLLALMQLMSSEVSIEANKPKNTTQVNNEATVAHT